MSSKHVAVIWQGRQPEYHRWIRQCMDSVAMDEPISLFFRADDIGVPGNRFFRMMDLFLSYGMPLCLAVVPAWITPARWQRIRTYHHQAPELWCWHQHGWRHFNHELEGKKQEFGSARDVGAIFQDLNKGAKRLRQVLGDAFFPAFTPPWNRCNGDTVHALAKVGFSVISGFQGKLPPLPTGLKDMSVNVDLHTRKDPDTLHGWQALCSDFQRALAMGRCGVMIHHQWMNDAAFGFLESLLQIVSAEDNIRPVHFKDIIISAS